MKKLLVSLIVCIVWSVLFVIGCGSFARAKSMEIPTTEGDPELTIVFGAPEEFDGTQGTTPVVRTQQESMPQMQLPAPEDNLTVVPEPSTLMLLGIGVLGLIGLMRKK